MRVYKTEFPFNLIEDLGFNIEEVIDKFEDKLDVISKRFLNAKQRLIIDLYYKENLNYADLGKKFDITRERVRQMNARLIRTLKHFEHYFIHGCFIFEEMFEKEKNNYIERKKEEWNIDSAYKFLVEKGVMKPINERNNNMLLSLPINIMDNIEKLNLSTRAYNCLTRAKKNTILDVMNMTTNELLKIRNLGIKAAKEIEEKIHKCGFRLKSEVEEDED